MSTLQALLEKHVQDSFKIEVLGPKFVQDRFRILGIKLSRSQYRGIVNHFKTLKADNFVLRFKDSQVIEAGFKSEEELQEAFQGLPGDLVTDFRRYEANYFKALPDVINEKIEKISLLLLKSLKRNSTNSLKLRRKDFSGFQNRLQKSRKGAFDLLEMLIAIAIETGADFNNEIRPQAADQNDTVFESLTRLHARACQIASEILVLLQAGYADGAHARWRSLHEVVVVALFISMHGTELAERYLLHDTIECFKASLIYQEHCKKLGYDSLTKQEIEELKTDYDLLTKQFGGQYSTEYGWAYPEINAKNLTFRDLERAAGLEHLRPFYKMACQNVHANPRGIFFKLGLHSNSGEMLLAGPSNVGLADPGHSAALSLAQITTALLTHQPNLDRLVICKILMKLVDEIGMAFLDAETAVIEQQDGFKQFRIDEQNGRS